MSMVRKVLRFCLEKVFKNLHLEVWLVDEILTREPESIVLRLRLLGGFRSWLVRSFRFCRIARILVVNRGGGGLRVPRLGRSWSRGLWLGGCLGVPRRWSWGLWLRGWVWIPRSRSWGFRLRGWVWVSGSWGLWLSYGFVVDRRRRRGFSRWTRGRFRGRI